MVNVKRMLANRPPSNPDTSSSSRQPPNPSASSSGWQPPKTARGSSQPSRVKGAHTFSGTGHAGGASSREVTRQLKRSRPEVPKVKHGKGKPLCPHLFSIDPSKDLWRHPDLGSDVLRHNVREADLTYLQPRSSDELLNSAYSDLARIPAVLHTLAARAQRFEEVYNEKEKFEEKCRDLSREVAQLKIDRDSTRRHLEKELMGVRAELKEEIGSGRRYLETLRGQRFLKAQCDDALSQFKESMEYRAHRDKVIAKFQASTAFEEAVERASLPVFDECVAYCRERLMNSGRYPGDKFELLDPDWVEMIETSPTGNSSAARVSQGTAESRDLGRIGVVSGKAIFGPPLDEYWKKKLQEETLGKENDAKVPK